MNDEESPPYKVKKGFGFLNIFFVRPIKKIDVIYKGVMIIAMGVAMYSGCQVYLEGKQNENERKTEQEKRQNLYQLVFPYADKDGNGRLSVPEQVDLFQRMGYTKALIDLKGNGLLEYNSSGLEKALQSYQAEQKK